MISSSIVTTLAHTPWWVFAVLAALLFLGYQQSRSRTMSRKRLMLLPLAMLLFSFYSAFSSFDLGWLTTLGWVVGFGSTILAGAPKELAKTGIGDTSKPITVQGSWWPLILMMVIFCIRYLLGYAQARSPALLDQPWFMGSISFSLGLLSGVFMLRAWLALRSAST